MNKDFDSWNGLKKNINSKNVGLFCNTREIWWASLGLNIGSEEDGKNELFERPVLIIKILNQKIVRIVPLTTALRDDSNHVPILSGGITGSAKLSQLKTISTQRLSRKMARLDITVFNSVVQRLKDSLV